MDNTNRGKFTLTPEVVLLLKGLIVGKIMTLVVIGGLFWWLLWPRLLWVGSSSSSFANQPNQSLKTNSDSQSTFQTVEDVPVGSFKYGGSTAWIPIRQFVDSQIQNTRLELQLRYTDPTNGNPSSSSGIQMLLDKQLDFAQSSRPLTEEEYNIAKQRGFILKQNQVGKDGIAVVVNPSLQVPGLTVSQLQQIYVGKINNWKQVGGPDLAITPFALSESDTDTFIFSSQSKFKKQELNSRVKYVSSTTEALRLVNKTPGSLYYASARAVVPQCSVKPLPLGHTPTKFIAPYREPKVLPQKCPYQRNQINTEAFKDSSYPLTTGLFIIVKQNNKQEQRVAEAYTRLLLTDQGQKAIEQAGFVGIP
jgi:phosphate transport system substrate-binding protein